LDGIISTSVESLSQVLANVRRLCAEQEAIVAQRAAPNPSPPKRARREGRQGSGSDDEYAALFQEEAPVAAIRDELDQYLLVADPSVKPKDLLKWWKEKVQSKYKCTFF
jgi:hypothetical protein